MDVHWEVQSGHLPLTEIWFSLRIISSSPLRLRFARFPPLKVLPFIETWSPDHVSINGKSLINSSFKTSVNKIQNWTCFVSEVIYTYYRKNYLHTHRSVVSQAKNRCSLKWQQPEVNPSKGGNFNYNSTCWGDRFLSLLIDDLILCLELQRLFLLCK